MHRTSMTFQIVPDFHRKGNFLLNLHMVKWDDHEIIASSNPLETRMYEVEEYDDTDPLVWAEVLCDAMYKTINTMRAARADSGWISGTCGTGDEASENVTPEV